MTQLLVCNQCGYEKHPWQFPVRSDGSGKPRPYCRDCEAGMHKPSQPSTTGGVMRGRAIIEARLGSVPRGCIDRTGFKAVVCPYLAQCRALPVEAELICEVSDSMLGLPLVP